jgi:hypothetical protein
VLIQKVKFHQEDQFYATSKVVNPNQYGQLGSSSPVSMHSGSIPFWR